MRAIRQHAFGGPEELRMEVIADPHPAEGQVRIRVESAGVHLIDTVIRRGEPGGPYPLPDLPMTPGREVAGRIDETGSGVDRALAGRAAVVDLGPASGGYAEVAIAPATALHLLPDGLTADDAVAMIGTGRTAIHILEVAAATPSDVALVTAAAGGIGTLLVQALRNTGATVIALAGSGPKAALTRKLGATAAVDYSQPGWAEVLREALRGHHATLVLDGVGGDVGRTAMGLLVPGGRLVLFGSASGSPTQLSAADLFAQGITATAAIGVRLIRRPGGLRPLEAEALRAAAERQLAPVIGQRFALADAAGAHKAIEARATSGKTVLIP
jgi:NADPH:quinone reductase